MQFSMSKVALAFTGLGLLSGAAFAGNMGDVLTAQDKRWFGFAAPIYGQITDGEINRKTLTTTNLLGPAQTEYMPALDSKLGLNVGIGYRFGQAYNEKLSLAYTYLQSDGSKTISNNSNFNNSTDISRIIGSMDGQFTVSANTKITYNNFELAMNRVLDGNWDSNLELSRIYAIKATFIQRKFTTRYTGTIVSAAPNVNGVDVTDYNYNFFGVGPKAGFGALYKFTPTFSIGGDLSLGILAGQIKSRFNENLTLAAPASGIRGALVASTYSFNRRNPSASQLAAVVGGNFSLKQSFTVHNDRKLDVELGYGGEYLTSTNVSDELGRGLKLANTFAVENIFLRFSYFS